MKYKFLRPDESGSADDFESKITELAMKVDRDFGSFDNAAKTAQCLFEKAQPYLLPTEIPQFLKLIYHFKFLSDLAQSNEEDYFDLQTELNSYITGNVTYDEENRELIYLDHPNFKEKYPKFKPNGIL